MPTNKGTLIGRGRNTSLARRIGEGLPSLHRTTTRDDVPSTNAYAHIEVGVATSSLHLDTTVQRSAHLDIRP
ncbi:hypothetical protein [Ornithinimicrobium murale]|uniref:hypothetical protein n=1 Tax=Ornithinimicrobium murale TaxID=1050153 RepID=UPI0013B36ED1|nr:hypothetical protein [Ornithinimicrobium murale]